MISQNPQTQIHRESNSSALDNLPDGVCFLDRRKHITYWNRGAEQITGRQEREVIGKSCGEMGASRGARGLCGHCRSKCPASDTMADGMVREIDGVIDDRQTQRAVPCRIQFAPIRDGAGRIVGVLQLFQDSSTAAATPLKSVQELQHRALLDAMTGVANRRYLAMNLQARQHELQAGGSEFGAILAEADTMEDIRINHGPDIAERAMAMAGRTIVRTSRCFDVVGRWSRGQFLALATIRQCGDLYAIAERMRSAVEQAFLTIDELVLGTTLSIGATAAYPTDTVEQLIERAQLLVLRSKAGGSNRVTI